MADCLCGSWRRTSFGLICRQCGKRKQTKKGTENSSQSFDAILHQIQSEYNNTDGDPKEHCQVLTYKIVNGEIIVTAIEYDSEAAKNGKFPKSITTWKY